MREFSISLFSRFFLLSLARHYCMVRKVQLRPQTVSLQRLRDGKFHGFLAWRTWRRYCHDFQLVLRTSFQKGNTYLETTGKATFFSGLHSLEKMISNNPDFSITIFFKAVIVTQKRVKDGIGLNDFWRISKAIFNVGWPSFDITGQEGFQLPSSILSPLQLIRNLCKGVDVCLQSLQELSCFLQSLQGRDGSINSRSYHGKVKITSLKLSW